MHIAILSVLVLFLIHSANRQSQLLVITIISQVVRPPPLFQNFLKQNKLEVKTVIALLNVGLAEEIIDETCLVD